jgi:hypothetical protein
MGGGWGSDLGQTSTREAAPSGGGEHPHTAADPGKEPGSQAVMEPTGARYSTGHPAGQAGRRNRVHSLELRS